MNPNQEPKPLIEVKSKILKSILISCTIILVLCTYQSYLVIVPVSVIFFIMTSIYYKKLELYTLFIQITSPLSLFNKVQRINLVDIQRCKIGLGRYNWVLIEYKQGSYFKKRRLNFLGIEWEELEALATSLDKLVVEVEDWR
jgi:hypothetical protein